MENKPEPDVVNRDPNAVMDASVTQSDNPASANEAHRCLIAPSPDLRKRIKTGFESLRGSVPSVLKNLLRTRQRQPVGMNDGTIYPGDLFPLGTPARVVMSAAADRAPLSGHVRVIVVLAEFPDKAMTQTTQHFQDLFFSTGVLANGSVKEYFADVTNNTVDIIGDVVGPYMLPNGIVHYANGESGTSLTPPNARDMARDAAGLANPDVNFGPFDNDGDGFVDAFIVIHAGPDAAATGDANDIWSHKWVLSGGSFNADGTQIFAYLTVGEDAQIGVCCHELGHLLFGFPDLYDTDGSGEGVGDWCLMGGGSWLGPNSGDVPAHPSAWCKADQGWVNVINKTVNGNQTIADVKTSNTVYRLWKDGAPGSEYFLVENRQQAGYDQHLPGEGLLIWHIDETVLSNSDENHPKVALEQADGLRNLENGDNRGNDGDPWPGSSNNTAFNESSTPNSKSYGNLRSCVEVTNISPSAASMTADLRVMCRSKSFLKDLNDFKVNKERKEIFKEAEKWPDGGFGFGRGAQPGSPPARGDLESRVEALEAMCSKGEPFIDASMRPNLRTSALANEEDVAQSDTEMKQGAARAKRNYDTKPRE